MSTFDIPCYNRLAKRALHRLCRKTSAKSLSMAISRLEPIYLFKSQFELIIMKSFKKPIGSLV